MAALNSGKIIRRVRLRLEVSQEGLARRMKTTKGAVQHWERGRNIPGKGHLLALRRLCTPSQEREDLDALIGKTRKDGGPVNSAKSAALSKRRDRGSANQSSRAYKPDGLTHVRRENSRLQRQVAKLETALKSREERVRILEHLATDLQREMAQVRAKH